MSTLVGGSGEPNNEQDDAVTGGKDQLKLNEETWAFLLRPLNSLRSATADLSGEDTAEASDLLPQEWKPPVAGLCVAQSFGTCVCVYTHSHRCPRAARHVEIPSHVEEAVLVQTISSRTHGVSMLTES